MVSSSGTDESDSEAELPPNTEGDDSPSNQMADSTSNLQASDNQSEHSVESGGGSHTPSVEQEYEEEVVYEDSEQEYVGMFLKNAGQINKSIYLYLILSFCKLKNVIKSLQMGLFHLSIAGINIKQERVKTPYYRDSMMHCYGHRYTPEIPDPPIPGLGNLRSADHMQPASYHFAAHQPPEEKIIWMNIMCIFAIVVCAAHDRNHNFLSARGGKKVAHYYPISPRVMPPSAMGLKLGLWVQPHTHKQTQNKYVHDLQVPCNVLCVFIVMLRLP